MEKDEGRRIVAYLIGDARTRSRTCAWVWVWVWVIDGAAGERVEVDAE